MQRGARTDARAGRRTIDFAVGKDADVATVVMGLDSGSGKYCPVEKTQLRFERMLDRKTGHYCMLDAPAIIDELVVMIRGKSEAERLRLNKRVECATISNIESHPTEAGHFNLLVTQVQKRGNVAERNFTHFVVFHYGLCVNLARWNIDG